MSLWPQIPEHGTLYRLTVRCGDCDGAGTAEVPRGSHRFDICPTCGGSGETEARADLFPWWKPTEMNS